MPKPKPTPEPEYANTAVRVAPAEILTVTLHKPVHVQLLEQVLGTLRAGQGYQLFHVTKGIAIRVNDDHAFETIYESNIASTLERHGDPADSPNPGVPASTSVPDGSGEVRSVVDTSAERGIREPSTVQGGSRGKTRRQDPPWKGSGGSSSS